MTAVVLCHYWSARRAHVLPTICGELRCSAVNTGDVFQPGAACELDCAPSTVRLDEQLDQRAEVTH